MSLSVSTLEPLLPRLSLRMRVVVCTSIALNLTLAVGYLVHENSLGRDPFDWNFTLTERTPTFHVASLALFFHLTVLMAETARNGWRAYRAKRPLTAAEAREEHLLGQPADPRVTSSAYSSVAAIAGAWLVGALWLVPVGVYGFALVSGRGFPDGEPPVWMAVVVTLMQVAALAAMVCTATFATHERRYGARAIYLP
ncbi:hypothetical protein HDZ31DRAFT_80265 [Schizophyllum fasciatum]